MEESRGSRGSRGGGRLTMVEQWLQATIQEFGKRLGLSQFLLNEKGAAGVSFENGITFRLEYQNENIFLCMAIPMQESPFTLKKLLQTSHPAANRTMPGIHAAYLPKSQRAMLMTTLRNRDLSVPLLDKTFSRLWELIHKL